jgi:hypothetical protein
MNDSLLLTESGPHQRPNLSHQVVIIGGTQELPIEELAR